MKVILILLLLAIPAHAQEWKPIKEMSGPIPDHPGITIETSASQIARGGDIVKLRFRADFPWGSPGDLVRNLVPWGFDPTSISRVEFKLLFNCQSLTVTPVTGSADVYQFNGKKHKSKEIPVQIPSGHIFAQYFCEQGSKPITAPVLKPM